MHAPSLFSPIASDYSRPADVLSVGQYARWRRALVAGLDLEPGARVLDVATGTGLIADLLSDAGYAVTGVDLTEAMLRESRTEVRACADANSLPFAEGAFDGVTFSYLFRYVADPEATMRELTRALRKGGVLASVEFGVPRAPVARAGWRLYARGVMPTLSRAFGPAWHEVGAFLPPNIEAWARAWPVARQVQMWNDAGMTDVRVREMTLGTGVVMWGRKR